MLQKTASTGTESQKQVVSGAELFVKALERENVEVIFGYPGGAVLPIYDSIYKTK